MTADLEQLKSSVDLRQVFEVLGIKRNGPRYFCPSCQSKGGTSPSLSIKGDRFKCFKCGQSGDVIDLVQFVTGKEFVEARTWLEQTMGQDTVILHPDRASDRANSFVSPPSRPTTPTRDRSSILGRFLSACEAPSGKASAFRASKVHCRSRKKNGTARTARTARPVPRKPVPATNLKDMEQKNFIMLISLS